MSILSLRIPLRLGLIVAVCGVSLSLVQADVLEMKNGKVLNGKFVGGTAGTIRFETSEGIQVIAVGDALALTFTGGGATQAAQKAPATPAPATPETAATPAPVETVTPAASPVILAGTPLLVRMMEGISSRDEQGKRFTATLETDLNVGGQTVVARGTKLYGRLTDGKQAGGVIGKSKIALELTDIMINGTLQPIRTGSVKEAGANSARGTARRAGAGAAIGAAVDGSSGAKRGAAVGAAVGLLGRGETVSIKPNDLLEFDLRQPLEIR